MGIRLHSFKQLIANIGINYDMYKCKIYKDIYPADPSESDKIPEPVCLFLECEMPFAPYTGIEITHNGIDCIIISVNWNTEASELNCRVKYEYPEYGNEFKELVKWSIDDGWSIISWPKQYIETLGRKPE